MTVILQVNLGFPQAKAFRLTVSVTGPGAETSVVVGASVAALPPGGHFWLRPGGQTPAARGHTLGGMMQYPIYITKYPGVHNSQCMP